jgi:hypothetical protein
MREHEQLVGQRQTVFIPCDTRVLVSPDLDRQTSVRGQDTGQPRLEHGAEKKAMSI